MSRIAVLDPLVAQQAAQYHYQNDGTTFLPVLAWGPLLIVSLRV